MLPHDSYLLLIVRPITMIWIRWQHNSTYLWQWWLTTDFLSCSFSDEELRDKLPRGVVCHFPWRCRRQRKHFGRAKETFWIHSQRTAVVKQYAGNLTSFSSIKTRRWLVLWRYAEDTPTPIFRSDDHCATCFYALPQLMTFQARHIHQQGSRREFLFGLRHAFFLWIRLTGSWNETVF